MAKNQNKVHETKSDVLKYIQSIKDDQQQKDCMQLLELMTEVTGIEAKMWGKDIVGFGSYHYIGKSGREGDWFKTGFAPRKNNLSIYFIAGFDNKEDLLIKLGKHKLGKGCLYVKNLDEVNEQALKELIKINYKEMTAMHAGS